MRHVADVVKCRNLLKVSINLNETQSIGERREMPLFHLVQCIEMYFILAYVRSK